jgi:hypothetical protein
MAGDCGKCTMCCKLLAVSDLKKPKNKLCEHCKIGVGCKIYDDRPESCEAFKCLWLQTQDHYPPLPMNLRPDKCKVVLHTTPDERSLIAKVDPNYPEAWRASDIGLLLGKLAEKVLILVDNGEQYWALSKGQARKVEMTKPDEEGTEHFVRYLE